MRIAATQLKTTRGGAGLRVGATVQAGFTQSLRSLYRAQLQRVGVRVDARSLGQSDSRRV